jgi:hypothetical protein
MDVEENVRDVFCCTVATFGSTVGFTKSLVAVVNRGYGVVNGICGTVRGGRYVP